MQNIGSFTSKERNEKATSRSSLMSCSLILDSLGHAYLHFSMYAFVLVCVSVCACVCQGGGKGIYFFPNTNCIIIYRSLTNLSKIQWLKHLWFIMPHNTTRVFVVVWLFPLLLLPKTHLMWLKAAGDLANWKAKRHNLHIWLWVWAIGWIDSLGFPPSSMINHFFTQLCQGSKYGWSFDMQT